MLLRKKIISCTLTIILTLGTAIAMAGCSPSQQVQKADLSFLATFFTTTQSNFATLTEFTDPFYTLVIGTDSRSSDPDVTSDRADAIMLVRVDPLLTKVTLISIMRDTKVAIEGYGTNKINAAYAFGGVDLLKKTVEKLYGVEISYYAKLGFVTTKKLVNELGGVTVNVPQSIEYNGASLKAGKQKLNGAEALLFSRVRKSYGDGDFSRVKAQRILFEAVLLKLLASPASEYSSLVQTVEGQLKTDVPLELAVQVLNKFKDVDAESIVGATAPAHAGMENGVSYVFLETAKWRTMLERIESGKDPE
jgi:LCP family protein required for cell wall assembly